MNPERLVVRGLSVRYGRQLVFHGVSFTVAAGHCLGVIAPNGAGKTTLLRTLVGLLRPYTGEVLMNGEHPPAALSRVGVAYFAGEATLPGFVRAAAWGRLGNGDAVTPDTRRLRALSRGTRQLLGLRTVLGRQPLDLVVLDEPWEGLDTERHSASLVKGTPGVLHGALSYLLQDAGGQVHPAHSISAGLDYPGVGPEHAYLKDSGRATYVAVTDDAALRGVATLSRLEGIIPALETAHAVAWVADSAGRWRADDAVLICVSGRGDKDVAQLSRMGAITP